MRLRHHYKRSDDLVQRARGGDILAVARGLQPKLRRLCSAEWAGPCPAGCARRDGFIVHPGKKVFLCRPSAAAGDIISMVMHVFGLDFIEACKHITGESSMTGRRSSPVRPIPDESEAYAIRKREIAAKIWTASKEIASTIGHEYFCSRAVTGPLPDELRFLPSLEHWPTRQMLPAVVARVSAVDGAFLGVHLTFLTFDGLGDKRKLMLGGTRGGAVRLAEPAGAELMVAEGIETALSVMEATGRPTWAALSTSGLRSLELPAGVTSVTIASDGDLPGAQAADSAAKRWRGEGRRVLVRPAPPGMDFNDIAQARARAEAVAIHG